MSTIGTVLYIASMWVNGILQGLMWRAYNQDGTLTYSFVESVEASYPGYVVRVIGGAIFFSRHVDDGLQRLHDQPQRHRTAGDPGCCKRGIRS